MPCRFFNKEAAKLPQIKGNGDVLLIRSIRVKDLFGQMIGISNHATSWVIIPKEFLQEDRPHSGLKVVLSKSSAAEFPSRAELEYAKNIWIHEDQTSWSRQAAPTILQTGSVISDPNAQPSTKPRKLTLVKDLDVPSSTNWVFVDLLGEVRRMYSTSDRVELFISDYTSHEGLYQYEPGCADDETTGDQYGYITKDKKSPWPGPWDQHTISVTLWDAHFTFAVQKVRPGKFVALRNVQITMDKSGRLLEGKCRGDKRFPDKINVAVLRAADAEGDQALTELLQRKRKYEEMAKRRNWNFIRDPGTIKKQPDNKAGEEQTEKTSKKGKRDRKKKRGNAQQTHNLTTMQSNGSERVSSGSKLNENVACEKHDEANVMPITEILDPAILQRKTSAGNTFQLPFQNAKYKVEIRCMDFFPPNLEDFSVPCRQSQYDALDEAEDDGDTPIPSDSDSLSRSDKEGEDVQWKWRFLLQVQDKKHLPNKTKNHESMELLVADEDGDFLLDMDACDLRREPKQLANLREKLFMLWGDLEEQKKDATTTEHGEAQLVKASGRPFQCYIKEYGVRVPHSEGQDGTSERWQRTFRLWGATIKR